MPFDKVIIFTDSADPDYRLIHLIFPETSHRSNVFLVSTTTRNISTNYSQFTIWSHYGNHSFMMP